jgi:histidinol phosphatase-like PHP family hydrolase
LLIDKTSDYHMHSVYSDGDASIDAMARSASDKGLTQVTITDHMPLPFDTRYASPWIMHEATAMGIPMVLGSDSHNSGTLGQYFNSINEWYDGLDLNEYI